jgi:ABC-type transport system involved in cytochrome bd biosynthesis fused ATPase/permease subunit
MTTTTATERNTFQAHRRHEARLITTALTVLGGIGFAAAVVPAVEHTITTSLLVLGVLVAAAVAVRVLARWVRHRREDRADALTAAAWRARHAPHLLTAPAETAGPVAVVGDRRAA